MSVSSTTNRVSYAGNGTTTVFSFPFYFLTTGDLAVLTIDAAGTVVTKVITTDYTVTGTQAVNGTFPSGGSVTMGTAPPSGTSLSIVRVPAQTQASTWLDGDPDPATVKETAFDKLTLLAQRLSDRVSRALRLSEGYVASFNTTLPTILTPGASICINGTGDGLILGPTQADIANAEANALAAAASATAAAGSASSASSAAASAAATATAAVTATLTAAVAASATAASGSATAAAGSASSASSAATAASASAAAASTSAASISKVVFGSSNTPQTVTASGGIICLHAAWQTSFIIGSPGAVTVTASSPVSSGLNDADEMLIIGTDDTKTVTMNPGTTLHIAGPIVMGLDTVLCLAWNAGNSYWIEKYRTGDKGSP